MSTEQEQIDELTQTLISELVAANRGLSIQEHSDPNHLIVFQENEDGSTHQFLLGITYIGPDSTEQTLRKLSQVCRPLLTCRESNRHLTSCDDDGYCNFCGEQ